MPCTETNTDTGYLYLFNFSDPDLCFWHDMRRSRICFLRISDTVSRPRTFLVIRPIRMRFQGIFFEVILIWFTIRILSWDWTDPVTASGYLLWFHLYPVPDPNICIEFKRNSIRCIVFEFHWDPYQDLSIYLEIIHIRLRFSVFNLIHSGPFPDPSTCLELINGPEYGSGDLLWFHSDSVPYVIICPELKLDTSSCTGIFIDLFIRVRFLKTSGSFVSVYPLTFEIVYNFCCWFVSL